MVKWVKSNRIKILNLPSKTRLKNFCNPLQLDPAPVVFIKSPNPRRDLKGYRGGYSPNFGFWGEVYNRVAKLRLEV